MGHVALWSPRPGPLDVLSWSETLDPFSHENVELGRMREVLDTDLPMGTPVGEEDVFDFWVQRIVDRHLSKYDTVVAVTGNPSYGKSTFAIEMCVEIREALNKALGISDGFDFERDMVSRLSDLSWRILQSSRERPSVVLADEGVLVGAQARSGLSETNVLLEKALSVCRIQGVVLFILCPSIWGIAAPIRNRRAQLWFHVERRGLSTAFELSDVLRFRQSNELPFIKAKKPWCRIHWGSLDQSPMWKPYETLKIAQTKRGLREVAVEAIKAEAKLGMKPPEWAGEVVERLVKGRAPGELPKEYARRLAREGMRILRAKRKLASARASPVVEAAEAA